MRHSAWTRLGVLTIVAALAIAACSSGFSGATVPSSAAAPGSEAPAASEAPTASAVSDEPVTLTYYMDDNNVTARLQGLTDAYTALHPNVTIEIETHPGGTEGDNLVKTRLATGEMSDIFYYNSGSLFQALNPTETLVDLSGEPFSTTWSSRTSRPCPPATGLRRADRGQPRWRHPLQQARSTRTSA